MSRERKYAEEFVNSSDFPKFVKEVAKTYNLNRYLAEAQIREGFKTGQCFFEFLEDGTPLCRMNFQPIH